MNCMVNPGGNYVHWQMSSNEKMMTLSADSVLQRPLLRLIFDIMIHIFNSFIHMNEISLISNVNEEAKFRSTSVKYLL